VRQDEDEEQGEIKKIAMNVLNYQRKRILTEISLTRFAHGTGRRISPECLIVSTAIVVARNTKTRGSPKD
jgi:hypothetical protein